MDNIFTAGCPCCAEELGLGAPAAPSTHHHPASNPRESARKELTQCQFCYKSREQGITLFKCSGCKVDIYCSKECQKKAWPTHKSKCKINRNVAAAFGGGDGASQMDALRHFTSKHRPTITEAGVLALELSVDPTRSQRGVLTIFLRDRPGPTRPETAFFVDGAEVVPMATFGAAKAAEMREQLKQANVVNVKAGAVGTLFVMLCCVDVGVSNIAPVGFWKSVLNSPPGTPWKEWMTTRLNEGIVA